MHATTSHLAIIMLNLLCCLKYKNTNCVQSCWWSDFAVPDCKNHQWYQQTTSADSLLLGQGTRANKQSIAVDPTQKDLVNPS